jgi:hypothetical protein
MPNSMDALRKVIDPSDFISPNSSLTPGAVGALTTTLTLALLPWLGGEISKEFPYVAIGISFLFALLVVMELREVSIVKRAIYLCLNTLVIFAVAAGAFFNLHHVPGPEEALLDKACHILDATHMDNSDRNFLKYLLGIGTKTPPHASLPSPPDPSAAYAQQDDMHAAPGPGRAETPASPRPDDKPTIIPQVTPEQLEKAKKYSEDKKKAEERQRQFILFPGKHE